MGIPGFNTWFYTNNKQAYQTLQQTQTDHLYIDMNSVLHNVLRKAENYDKYHALLHKRLDMILRLTNPRKSVMLAIDGPAPLAKLITQRERRKKSFTSEERKKERQQNSSSKKHKRQRAAAVVSSTALTPGTPFMHDVCVSCGYFICARLAKRKYSHLDFELSGPTVAGEGEVKILGRLARPRHAGSVSPTDTHLIVGDDADLILMALVSKTPRLHILNTALSDNELSPETAVLSVDKLHSTWLASGVAGITLLPQQQQQQQEDVLLRLLGAKADLALFAIMASGNDYLPAVKEAPKLETLWKSYVKLRKLPEFANSSVVTMTHSSSRSSSSGDVNIRGNGYCRELAVTAELDTLMLTEVLAVALEGNKYLQQLQEKHSAAAAAVGGVPHGGCSSSSSKGGDVKLTKEAAEALPWLKGLLWTMSMYFAGDCPDYRWSYSGRSPSVRGLRALAATATAAMAAAVTAANVSSEHHRLSLASFALNTAAAAAADSRNGSLAAWQAMVAAAASELSGSSGSSGFESLLPHVCSLALLPAGAQEHVPEAVQHLMEESSLVYDMYASCEGCEQAAADIYKAQTEYNVVLDKLKAVEAQISALQQQQQQLPDPQQQQQQQQQLYSKQEQLLDSKAAALALLNSAQDARRRHEAKVHPHGVDTFDLERLEAAVAAVPASEFDGHQKVLTQLSHSLLYRMGRQQQQQQRYGGYYGVRQQQQQHGRSYSSSSSSNIPGSRVDPPPPPVERFGAAFSYYGGSGPAVLRSILVEDADACIPADDPEVNLYGHYMVLGTDAAADSEAMAADYYQQQQQQDHNAAAAAALKAALKGGRGMLRPTHLAAAAAAGPPPFKSPKTAPGETAGAVLSTVQAAAAAAAAEAATAAAAAALASHSLGQQQQQQQGSKSRHGRSRSPNNTTAAAAAGAAAGGVKHPRRKSPSPKPPTQQQQQQQWVAGSAPAPNSIPMPSGALLGRLGGSSSSRWQQQQQQQQGYQGQQYDNGPAAMQYEYAQQQQQQQYNSNSQYQQQQYQYPQQQQAQQQQQLYYYAYQYSQQQQQQQQPYQPLRSVSPGTAAAAATGSSVPRPVSVSHPAPPQVYGGRPHYPHFPRP